MKEKNGQEVFADRNAVAFGEDTQVTPKDENTAEASQAESVVEKEQPTSEAESVVDEQKVPYSRMKTVIERARQAEKKAEESERRLEALERQRNTRTVSNEPYADAISARIKKLYGDNETSREIIEIELARAKEIEEIAERKANEAFDRRESSSRSEIEANERVLEDKIEDFSLSLGRDLTSDEEEAVLEIADKYSPVGQDGKYLSGEPLPLDRAWEIYEMQQASKGQTSKKARSVATALTSSKSEGETDTTVDSDDWKPGRWRQRLGIK